MKILVTGATGFVGSAVARILTDAGHSVRVLVRPSSDLKNIHGIDVEPVQGDLTDPVSLRTALKGCLGLFHVAADYRLWVPDPDEIYKANVQGTENIINAALDAGSPGYATQAVWPPLDLTVTVLRRMKILRFP